MYLFNIAFFYKYVDSEGVHRKNLTSNSYVPVMEFEVKEYFVDIFFKGFNKDQITYLEGKIILENENNYNEIVIFKSVKTKDLSILQYFK
jgi:hypothetical protein